jgi:hypothetical protein
LKSWEALSLVSDSRSWSWFKQSPKGRSEWSAIYWKRSFRADGVAKLSASTWNFAIPGLKRSLLSSVSLLWAIKESSEKINLPHCLISLLASLLLSNGSLCFVTHGLGLSYGVCEPTRFSVPWGTRLACFLAGLAICDEKARSRTGSGN